MRNEAHYLRNRGMPTSFERSIRGVGRREWGRVSWHGGVAWRPTTISLLGYFGLWARRALIKEGETEGGRKELRLLWPINKTVAAGMEWNGSGELGGQAAGLLLSLLRLGMGAHK